MPTSRTISRAAILPEGQPRKAPSRVMHWRQEPAEDPTASKGTDLDPIEIQIKQAPGLPSTIVHAHRWARIALAIPACLILALVGILFVAQSAGASLILILVGLALIQRAERSHDQCSNCRGRVNKRALLCPHCHSEFK